VEFVSEFKAVVRFFVQSLCGWCRTSLVANAQDLDRSGDVAVPCANHIAHFDLPRGFDGLIVDGHATFANFVCGQRPGFVKTGSPKPFIDSDFVHMLRILGGFEASCFNKHCFFSQLNPEGFPRSQPVVIIPGFAKRETAAQDRTQQLIPNRLRKF
jgi:hypothetical protein